MSQKQHLDGQCSWIYPVTAWQSQWPIHMIDSMANSVVRKLLVSMLVSITYGHIGYDE